MTGSDDRRRPVLGGPPIPREEDPPPTSRNRSRLTPSETIARMALRTQGAPSPNPDSPEELFRRAMASIEGRLVADVTARRSLFEDEIRAQLSELIDSKVKEHSVPPPSSKRAGKPFDWSNLQYVGGVIVAVTGLIALVINARAPYAELLKRLDAIDRYHLEQDKREKAAAEQSYEFQLKQREWLSDVLGASGVRVVDPPGTPPRDHLEFLPAPKVDPHRVTSAHVVQPRDPYPLPPPPLKARDE